MMKLMPANRDPDGRALRTRNLDEAIDAVTRVYCPHTVEVVGRARGIDAFLKITHSTFQPLVGVLQRASQDRRANDPPHGIPNGAQGRGRRRIDA
jgi:hypothetical protein